MMKTIGMNIWIQGPFNWCFIGNGIFLTKLENDHFVDSVATFIDLAADKFERLKYTINPFLRLNSRINH